MSIFLFIIAVLVSYVIGSVPTGYIFAKLLKKIDIRDYGSGNIGATNVFRTVGKFPGIIVLIIDVLKGLLVVTLVKDFFIRNNIWLSHSQLLPILLGLVVIAGHNWTLFLEFKGGKGVAAALGVLIGIAGMYVWICFAIWLVVVFIFGYVSLGSIIAAVALPVILAVSGKDLYLVSFAIIISALIIYRHRPNIRRLINGEEKKIR